MTWFWYALLSAFLAALTAILAKVGVKEVDADLATAVRATIILIFSWGMVFLHGLEKDLAKVSRFSLIFLILSGLATAASWLFYFRALQLGPAARVAPLDKLSLAITVLLAVVILKEKLTWPSLLGTGLMTVGAVIISLAK